MSEKTAYVRNASDPQQVKGAKETEKRRLDREREELRVVLGTVEGRRVLWRLLEYCGPYQSVLDDGGGRRIYYNAGQQDVGHYLMGLIGKADAGAYLTMQQDAAKLEQQVVEPKPRSEEPIDDA